MICTHATLRFAFEQIDESKFDKAFSGDNEYVQGIISVSFLENLSYSLHQDRERYDGIKNMLSLNLRKELSIYELFWALRSQNQDGHDM